MVSTVKPSRLLSDPQVALLQTLHGLEGWFILRSRYFILIAKGNLATAIFEELSLTPLSMGELAFALPLILHKTS